MNLANSSFAPSGIFSLSIALKQPPWIKPCLFSPFIADLSLVSL
eukprot:IDg15172t1